MGACHGDTRHWLDRGNGIDLWRCAALAGMGWWDWFVRACHGGTRQWLDWGNGIDLWWCAALAGTGWRNWFMGACHGGTRHWLDQGDGIYLCGQAMGLCNTGWIGAMGLIQRGAPWGQVTLAGSGRWFRLMQSCDTGWTGAMGLIYGGAWHWMERGDGIDLWGLVWGRVTGSGRWDWFLGARHGGATLAGSGRWFRLMQSRDTGWTGAMGLIYGGAWHWMERGDGIDLWGLVWGRVTGSGRWDWFLGARHGGATLDGCGLWAGVMGACYGGVQLDRGDGMDLWGRAMGRTTLTKSVRWDRFMWARNGGTRHWLDRGDGIDSWGHAKWQSTIWLLNLNDDTMCPHVWRWGKCA